MGDPLSPCASQTSKLRDRFELEECDFSYADLHSEITEDVGNMATSTSTSTSSGLRQKQHVKSKAVENEEIVKHMSNLPSYLERGKNLPDKALNIGVIDWGNLEKWHYNHKQVPCKRNSYSQPSSSNSSSYFSTEGSSTLSSRGHSCSPARQFQRPTLQSQFDASPKQIFTPSMKSSVGNLGKFQDFKDVPKSTLRPYQSFHNQQLKTNLKECKRKDSYPHSISETKSSMDSGSCRMTSSPSKGKMKIQDDDESKKGKEKFQESYYSILDHDDIERHKNVVLLLPRDGPDSCQRNGRRAMEASRRSFVEGPLQSEVVSGKHSHMEPNTILNEKSTSDPSPARIPTSPSRSKKLEVEKTLMSSKCSDPNMGTVAVNKVRSLSPRRPLQTEVVSGKHSHREPNTILSEKSTSNPSPARISTSPSRSKKLEEKKTLTSSKCSDPKMDSVAGSKLRSLSPLRRFSIGMSKIGRSSSSGDRAEASALSHNSTRDNSNVSSTAQSSPMKRAHSSPLRRLLDPLFPSKATNSHNQSAETSQEDNSKTKVKAKLDLRSCKEINVDDSHRNQKNESSTTTQALFQIAVKNGRPLFTFAVENNNDILAATMRKLSSSSGKDGNSWIYTFFSVHEVKKKNSGSWLNQGSRGKGQGYVPNVTAQMKVSDSDLPVSNLSKCRTREFVLFAVDLKQLDDHQMSDVQPRDELAAIVFKFPRKAIKGENELCVASQDLFSTTVVLSSGDHGLPSKGEPSPLIERWRSGGLCDCGGWDEGCRIRILANHTQTKMRSSSTKVLLSTGRFELFSQGEYLIERPFFSLSPLKEGFFSVEFNSSLSLVQAFSICISVLDSRKPCQLSESSNFHDEELSEEATALPNQVQEDVAVRYASYPPLSPVGRV